MFWLGEGKGLCHCMATWCLPLSCFPACYRGSGMLVSESGKPRDISAGLALAIRTLSNVCSFEQTAQKRWGVMSMACLKSNCLYVFCSKAREVVIYSFTKHVECLLCGRTRRLGCHGEAGRVLCPGALIKVGGAMGFLLH